MSEGASNVGEGSMLVVRYPTREGHCGTIVNALTLSQDLHKPETLKSHNY